MIRMPPPEAARDVRQLLGARPEYPPSQYDGGLSTSIVIALPRSSPRAPSSINACAASVAVSYRNGRQTDAMLLERPAASAIRNADAGSCARGLSTPRW